MTSSTTENRAQSGWIENRPHTSVFSLGELRELWAYRELAGYLALRDIKLRYRQTVIGVAWVLVRPLLAMAIFTILLGKLGGLPSDGLPYGVFVLAGLTMWLYVSSSVEAAAESLVEHRSLVDKVYFPRYLAPLAAVLAALPDLGICLVVLAAVVAVAGVEISVQLVTVPIWCLAAVVVAMGPALWLSALNVLYRDVRYALGFGIQAWLFLSPVIFPSSLVEGDARVLFALNPMAGLIDAFRWAAVDGPPPPTADLVSVGTALLLLVTGFAYFRRVESVFADRI